MAQDDMHVVMYKILAYLYACMKKGIEPDRRHYAHDGDVLSIPYPYWATIIDELQSHGYVSGFVIQREWGGGYLIDDADPRITMEGVEFLQENGTMKKALKFLKEAKNSLPFI